MSKRSKDQPQPKHGNGKTFPLDEVNAMKRQKEEVQGIPGRPKDESYKSHKRTP